jgi:hypothetical protein
VHDLDRRQFLTRASALLAATSGLGLASRLTAPAAAATVALTERRQAVYRALLATLRESPDGRFRHRDAAAGARAFADSYAAQPEAARAHADAVLDAVEEILTRTSGTARRRYATLRDRPGGAAPADDEARRRATLLAAVALVEGPTQERSATEALA